MADDILNASSIVSGSSTHLSYYEIGDTAAAVSLTNISNMNVSTPGLAVALTSLGNSARSTDAMGPQGYANISWQQGQADETSYAGFSLDSDGRFPPDFYLLIRSTGEYQGPYIYGSAPTHIPVPRDYDTDTVFEIVYDGVAGTLKWYIDDVLRLTTTGIASDLTLYFYGWLQNTGTCQYEYGFWRPVPKPRRRFGHHA